MNDVEFTWSVSAQGVFHSLSRKMLLHLWFDGQEPIGFKLFCRSVEYWLFLLRFLLVFFLLAVLSATVRYNVYICTESFPCGYWSILRKKLYLISWVSHLETTWQAKGTFSEKATFQYLSEEKRLVLQMLFTETDAFSHSFRWIWKSFFFVVQA